MKLIWWWNRWPQRLQYELQELEQAGIRYEFDERARSVGIIRLHVWCQIDGHETELVATYPDLYPYFRLELEAPSLDLPYHQNPFQKNLCLLGRWTGNWRSDFTLGWILRTQLPQVLRVAQETEVRAVANAEEHQAEPIGDYYPYDRTSTILIDTRWQLDASARAGTFLFAPQPRQVLKTGLGLRAAMLEVYSASGRLLARADPLIHSAFPGPRMSGRWVRVAEPIRTANPSDYRKAIESIDSAATSAKKNVWDDPVLQLWGVLFPQEVAWRDKRHKEGWAFLARIGRQVAVIPPWYQPEKTEFQWHLPADDRSGEK